MLTEWLHDIKKNQLPSILGGVGPMYSLVQLCEYVFLISGSIILHSSNVDHSSFLPQSKEFVICFGYR